MGARYHSTRGSPPRARSWARAMRTAAARRGARVQGEALHRAPPRPTMEEDTRDAGCLGHGRCLYRCLSPRHHCCLQKRDGGDIQGRWGVTFGRHGLVRETHQSPRHHCCLSPFLPPELPQEALARVQASGRFGKRARCYSRVVDSPPRPSSPPPTRVTPRHRRAGEGATTAPRRQPVAARRI